MAVDPLAAWDTYAFTPQKTISAYELAYILSIVPAPVSGKAIITTIRLQPGKVVDPIVAKHFTKQAVKS